MTRKAITKPENFKSPPKEKIEKGKILPPVKKVITKNDPKVSKHKVAFEPQIS